MFLLHPLRGAESRGSPSPRSPRFRRLARQALYLALALSLFSLLSSGFSSLVRPSRSVAEGQSVASASRAALDGVQARVPAPWRQPVGPDNWYDPAWRYRRAIAIDNTASASEITDYQIRVSLSSRNFDFSVAQPSGGDLVFTDVDGVTPLAHWVERFDPSAQAATLWVKVPAIRAAGTETIYLYYGNPTASSTSDGARTFLFFDDLTDLSSYSTFGPGEWGVVADEERGQVAEVVVEDGDAGLYKRGGAASFVAEVWTKETNSVPNRGSWGGILVDMQDPNNWLRPGRASASGDALQVRQSSGGSLTQKAAPGAGTDKGVWYKEVVIYKRAARFRASAVWTDKTSGQGLATDGSYIYASSPRTLVKYDMRGNQVAQQATPPGPGTYGGAEYRDGYLYVILFESTAPTSTQVYRFAASDLSQPQLVKDITGAVGLGGNALAFKDGYWIVGETGGEKRDYDQHFYVFDSDWNLVKTLQSPYFRDFGAQDAAFKDNLLYVTQHDGFLTVFSWDPESLELRLVDADASAATGNEGIAWDARNARFYTNSRNNREIQIGNFADATDARIVYYVDSSSSSHGVMAYDFRPKPQAYFGLGAYRDQRFSTLLVRAYAFDVPLVIVGEPEENQPAGGAAAGSLDIRWLGALALAVPPVAVYLARRRRR